MDVTPLYIISVPGKEAGSMLDKLPLNGKKTYVVAAVTVIYAVSGILLGDMDTTYALSMIAGALGLTTIGHKIDKSNTN
tara:strand:+ start:988 stop:1224 length:237 start_codon:yes stop_codon:yes gene_type:complete